MSNVGVPIMKAKAKNLVSIFLVNTSFSRGREPQDGLSLHYADMSLSDLLGRPSLRYAVISTLKCAYVIQKVF